MKCTPNQGSSLRASQGRTGRGASTIIAAAMTIPQALSGSNLPLYGYRVQHVYPHDPNAFTQGLQYVDGFLYEGTGLNGRSSIRKVKLETGEIVQQRAVPKEYFGEGIAVWKSDLIELTWQSEVAFVYDSR